MKPSFRRKGATMSSNLLVLETERADQTGADGPVSRGDRSPGRDGGGEGCRGDMLFSLKPMLMLPLTAKQLPR